VLLPCQQRPYPLSALPPVTSFCTSNNYRRLLQYSYSGSPISTASNTSPRSRQRREAYCRAGTDINTVVPTASHASSRGRGASATAGQTSDFALRSARTQNTSLSVPEDAHRNNNSTITPSADANPRVPSPSFQPPYPSPVASPPRRWSLRNAFSPLVPPPLNLQARHGLPPPRLQPQTITRSIVRPRPGGRLWNPTNSTPRAPRPRSPDLEAAQAVPVPLHHPQIGGEAATGEAGGDYPLLTLQEQRQTRHSGTGTSRGSLQVEYNSSASGSGRISLPRSVSLDIRRSTEVEGDKDKTKGKESGGDNEEQATGQRKKRQSLPGPPVALKQQLDALGRQEARKRGQGRSKTGEIELNMASPDLELGVPESLQNYNPTDRAALPENRSRTSLSQHSGIGPPLSSSASSIHGSAHDVVLPGEDAEWGPSHPCYPHLNPHVPISSPLYQSTRIIRIRRDWMLEGDLAPTFSGLYPEILADAGLGEGEFRRVVEDVNNQLIPTFNPYNWRNILDAVLGLVTGWIWDDLGFTYAKMQLKKVEESLVRWNAEIEKQADGGMGAKFVPLRRSGYLTVRLSSIYFFKPCNDILSYLQFRYHFLTCQSSISKFLLPKSAKWATTRMTEKFMTQHRSNSMQKQATHNNAPASSSRLYILYIQSTSFRLSTFSFRLRFASSRTLYTYDPRRPLLYSTYILHIRCKRYPNNHYNHTFTLLNL
jgi:hypothetical protein